MNKCESNRRCFNSSDLIKRHSVFQNFMGLRNENNNYRISSHDITKMGKQLKMYTSDFYPDNIVANGCLQYLPLCLWHYFCQQVPVNIVFTEISLRDLKSTSISSSLSWEQRKAEFYLLPFRLKEQHFPFCGCLISRILLLTLETWVPEPNSMK